MLNELLTSLNHEWLSAPLAEPLTALKAAGSQGEMRKVNFLVFAHGSTYPNILIKLVRSRQNQDMLRAEHEKLAYLYEHPALRGRIPQPLGLFEYENALVMVETCLPGVAYENLLRRRKHTSQVELKREIGSIAAWLVDFHLSTAEGTSTFLGEQEVSARLSHLQQTLSPQVVQELNELAQAAKGISIPQTAKHGDFWIGNILMAEHSIGVIDWETLTRAASPFDDLFFFATTYTKKNFTHAFLENTWVAQELAALIKKVIQALGISPRFSSLFFVLFLMDMATNRTTLGRTGITDLPWEQYLNEIKSLRALVMAQ